MKKDQTQGTGHRPAAFFGLTAEQYNERKSKRNAK